MDFSINHKKFKGNFYNKIVKGIHARYKKIYPNSTIDVEYKVSKSLYTFFVYVTLDVINVTGVAPERTLIKTYNNFDAIICFSSIPLEDYMVEYDDSRRNYLEQFEEEVQAMIVSYKMLGMDIEPFKIDLNSCEYNITINIKSSWSSHEYIFSRFRFKGMITKEEYDNHTKDMRGRLKRVYEKWLERQ